MKLVPSRNVLNNKLAIVVYTGDIFTGMDFDTISVCVQPRLFMRNVDFSNRERLKVSSLSHLRYIYESDGVERTHDL